MKVLRGLEITVFNSDTVSGYRNFFRVTHPGHVWNEKDDAMFLRSIGAMGFDREDSEVYPTLAGLLMFGNEYDIVRETPNYFLDYREQLDPQIRWTHRRISALGEWSGNLLDFFFHVYNRLRAAVPVPFRLRSDGSRDDEVPMHKALREMLVNTLAHADHYGRQGIVIILGRNTLTLATPGDMRPGLKAALSGGVSDVRNPVILKMFMMLGFGERTGRSIANICDICRPQLDAPPEYQVSYTPARTVLTVDIRRLTQTSWMA